MYTRLFKMVSLNAADVSSVCGVRGAPEYITQEYGGGALYYTAFEGIINQYMVYFYNAFYIW